MARLKEYYKDTVVKELTKQFSYKNPMQVPKITKIVLNIGSGEFSDKNIRARCARDASPGSPAR